MSKQLNTLERRTIPCAFRISSDTDKPVIYGYAAKFGVRSDDLGGWVEVIAPTAFDAHLATNPDVRALFNHDANLILGRTSAGTLKVSKDDVGVGYEIDPPDTTAGRDLVTSMKRGDVSQSSFGFMCQDASWDYDEVKGIDVRTVKQAQLTDVSPVVFPAYPQATSGVRSLPADMPLEVRSKIEKLDTESQPTLRWEDTPDPAPKEVEIDADRSWRENTAIRLRLAQHRAK